MTLSRMEIKSMILCCDRVVNEDSVGDIKSAATWIPIPASLVAIARLTRVAYHGAVESLSLNHALSSSSA